MIYVRNRGLATFPQRLAIASDEIDNLVAVATKRGHSMTARETPWSFLERVIVEARTRAEIANSKAYRRRQKTKARAIDRKDTGQ